MNKLCSRYLCFLFFIIWGTTEVVAQDVSIEINAPEKVMQGEQFRVLYILKTKENTDKFIDLRHFDGFELLYGPAVSSTHTRTITGGKVEGDHIKTTTYVLRAIKKGKYTLPKAEVEIGEKKYNSEGVVVNVVTSKGISMEDNEAYIKTIVSRTNVGASDTLTLTYRLYSTMNVLQVKEVQFPKFTEFYSSDISLQRQSIKQETIDGKLFNIYDVKSLILQPRSMGEKPIAGGSMKIEFGIPTGRKVRNAWGQMLEEVVKKELMLNFDPVTINVLDLIEI